MGSTDHDLVDPTNAEQLRAWDGDEGAYWAARADYYDRAVVTHHQALMGAAAIRAEEHVLDIGCGTGQTTRDAARAATAGSCLGVDLSSAMLDHARRVAADEGIDNATFLQADAQIHPFDAGSFDLAISRTGAMFFGDPVAAFTNVAHAVRPGGRLALLTWQPLQHNEWMRELSGALAAGREMSGPPADAPGPFALSDPDRVRAILNASGFVDVELDGIQTGMWFGNDADDASDFVLGQLGWMLEGLDEVGRKRAVEALHDTTAAHHTADGVLFGSGAWVIRAVRS